MKRGSFILDGDPVKKQEYVDKFILDEQIPSYNIQEFNENFKIANARELIKTLAVKIPQGQARVIIIREEIQHEAQNALLKTLEELDDSVVVFFFSSNLLPTITSRSLKINVGEIKQTQSIAFEIYPNATPAERLLLLDQFFAGKRADVYTDLILAVRKAMFESDDLQKTKFTARLLKKLVTYSTLVRSNNLNPRIVAEKILLNN